MTNNTLIECLEDWAKANKNELIGKSYELAPHILERLKVAEEMAEALYLIRECVETASCNKHWSYGVAQALIPGRNKSDESISKWEDLDK